MGVFLMAEEADLESLVAAAQADSANSSAEMVQLIARFDPMIAGLSWRYVNSMLDVDDLVSEGRIALIAALRNHDGRPETFPGYARMYVRGAIIRAATREAGRDVPTERVDDTAVHQGEYEVAEAGFPDWWHDLSDDQRMVVALRDAGATLVEVGAHLGGISASAVRQRLDVVARQIPHAAVA